MATTLEHNVIVTCDECGNERIIEQSENTDGSLSDSEIELIESLGWFYVKRGRLEVINCPECLNKGIDSGCGL